MERNVAYGKIIILFIVAISFGLLIGLNMRYNSLVDKYSECINQKQILPEVKRDVFFELNKDGQINYNKSYTYEEVKQIGNGN